MRCVELKGKKYKVYGIVTHMDWDGEELIDWYHKRCGKSEQAHAVMKDYLAIFRFSKKKMTTGPGQIFLKNHDVV